MTLEQQAKLLSFGYIFNNICKNRNQIPNDINNLCSLFIGDKGRCDFFEIGGNGTRITNDCKTVSNSHKHWTTTYGSLIINPLNITKHKKYIWKFQIWSCKSSISIGIDETKHKWINDDFSGKKETINYSLCDNGSIYTHHGYNNGENFNKGNQTLKHQPRYGRNQIVTMTLEFSNENDYGKLIFQISGINYKIWDIDDIIKWLSNVNQGKFKQYIDSSHDKFIKAGITSGDQLKHLGRHELNESPFNIPYNYISTVIGHIADLLLTESTTELISFDKISKDTQYRMAISLGSRCNQTIVTCVELLDYLEKGF